MFGRERIGGRAFPLPVSGCRFPQRLRRRFRRKPVAEHRERGGLLRREPQHPCRVAHRAPPAPGDVLAHHGRVLAPVAFVHVLQHALAVAVREVDVDVGGFAPLLTQEPLEQQLELDGIHRRDAQHEAHGAVGGRAAPLTEHAFAAGEADDVPHDQEIARQPERADEREFVPGLPVVFLRAARSPAFARALLHELGEILVFAHAAGERKGGQRGLHVREPERAPFGDVHGRAHSLFMALPAPRDLRRTLQVPLAIRAEPGPHVVERRAVPERAHHVVREALGRLGVAHVVGDDPRQAEGVGERQEFAHDGAFLRERMIPAFEGDTALEHVHQHRRRRARRVTLAAGEELRHPACRRAGECEEAGGVLRERVERHAGQAARMIHARARDEGAEVAVSVAVLGEQHDMGEERFGAGGGHVERQFRPDDRIHPRRRGRRREPHGPAEVVAVGEREGAHAELNRARHELLGMRRAVEQGEGGTAVQLRVHGLSHTSPAAATRPRRGRAGSRAPSRRFRIASIRARTGPSTSRRRAAPGLAYARW